MFFIDDIIWLDAIVEKLMWKHRVMTSEVEKVLTGPCKVFKKEFGKVEGNFYITLLVELWSSGRHPPYPGPRHLSIF